MRIGVRKGKGGDRGGRGMGGNRGVVRRGRGW